jgi:hypothetical protein
MRSTAFLGRDLAVVISIEPLEAFGEAPIELGPRNAPIMVGVEHGEHALAHALASHFAHAGASRLRFLGSDLAIVIRIQLLEPLHSFGNEFLLGYDAIMIGIRALEQPPRPASTTRSTAFKASAGAFAHTFAGTAPAHAEATAVAAWSMHEGPADLQLLLAQLVVVVGIELIEPLRFALLEIGNADRAIGGNGRPVTGLSQRDSCCDGGNGRSRNHIFSHIELLAMGRLIAGSSHKTHGLYAEFVVAREICRKLYQRWLMLSERARRMCVSC